MVKKTNHVPRHWPYYPDKPYDPYNQHPYESVKEIRDWYGDFVTSTEGYTYFIVWINSIPSNRCKVVLFRDKEDISRYRSNHDVHPSEESTDWLHYSNSTDYLPINGRSAEELNNYIAKILMDFYNKRIYEYIEKNKPKAQTSSSINANSSERQQASQSSNNTHNGSSERPKVNNARRKSRYEAFMEIIEKYPDLQRTRGNKPKAQTSSSINTNSSESPQASQSSNNTHNDSSERPKENNARRKSRYEVVMEIIEKLGGKKPQGLDLGISSLKDEEK